jgi:hypothetical protein
MDELKNKLSGEYWSGKRWLVYDMLKPAGWLNQLHFFTDYSEAAAWCKAASGKNGVFRIRVLAEVLAGLNGVWKTRYTPDERRSLYNQLIHRPVSSFKKTIPLELGLRRNRYFPVLWNSELNPLSVVKTWQVISKRQDGQRTSRTQVLGSFPEFGKSMLAFMKAIRTAPPLAEELLLAGQLEDAVNILFYRFGRAVVAAGLDFEPEIEQVNDPTQPLILESPYFACYDRPRGMIGFYDGGLRLVKPGKDRCSLDLEYFDFEDKEIFDLQSAL